MSHENIQTIRLPTIKNDKNGVLLPFSLRFSIIDSGAQFEDTGTHSLKSFPFVAHSILYGAASYGPGQQCAA